MEKQEKRSVGVVTQASGAGSALGILLVWVASLIGLDVPEAVQGAVVVLLTLLGGYLVKPGTGTRRKA